LCTNRILRSQERSSSKVQPVFEASSFMPAVLTYLTHVNPYPANVENRVSSFLIMPADGRLELTWQLKG